MGETGANGFPPPAPMPLEIWRAHREIEDRLNAVYEWHTFDLGRDPATVRAEMIRDFTHWMNDPEAMTGQQLNPKRAALRRLVEAGDVILPASGSNGHAP